jgi:hypothetical protein
LSKTILESGNLEPWMVQKSTEKSEVSDAKLLELKNFKSKYLAQINTKNPTNHSLLTLYLNSTASKNDELSKNLLNLIFTYFKKQKIPLHISQAKKHQHSNLQELKRTLKSTLQILLLELCTTNSSEKQKVEDLVDFFTKIFELKFVGNLDVKIQKFLICDFILPFLKEKFTLGDMEFRAKLWKLLSVLYKTKLKLVDQSHIQAFAKDFIGQNIAEIDKSEL